MPNSEQGYEKRLTEQELAVFNALTAELEAAEAAEADAREILHETDEWKAHNAAAENLNRVSAGLHNFHRALGALYNVAKGASINPGTGVITERPGR